MKNVYEALYTFVDDRALRSPTSRALSDELVHYSYAELSSLSNHFAQEIKKIGTIKGRNIGLLYDRSAQSIILMLAIMKAGGIYVPLNRAMPTERLLRMIESADIETVIAPDVTHIAIATDINTLGPIDPSSAIEANPAEKADLAYAIFTSGSTGMPKLALLTHRAVSHVMIALTERYHIEQDDKVLQFANLSFDGSISEIFGAFIAGAELIIPSEKTIHSITQLSTCIHDRTISVAILPPSLLTHLSLVDTQLKTIVVAGEACPSRLAKQMTTLVPHFINAYGPTECAICVSTYEIPKDFNEDITPIGEPLPGVHTYVIDDAGAIAPSGTTGELYVGGPTLFSGYYNDPKKTAAALIHYSTGELVYKTGDFVYAQGETLTYISRTDDYLKLNGIRISPLEIEEVIQRYSESIKGVAVIAPENMNDRRLIAFYTSDQLFTPRVIAAFAKEHLPPYAVPHTFIHLSKMPLNDNQKVDRRALLAHIPNDAILEATSFMQSSWQSILHTNVDGTTDFFLAGGDSLKAMRLVVTIERELGIDLTLSDLFDHPVFDDFVAYIKGRSSLKTRPTYDSDSLTTYETMLWSASAHAGNPAAYTLTEILKPQFTVDEARLKHAIAALSNHFTAPSYRYVLGDKGLEKQKSNTGITYISHGTVTQDEFDSFADTITNAQIDLAGDPLVTLHFYLVNQQPQLIIHAHHIVLSASMLSAFIKEIWETYTGTTALDIEEAPKDFADNDATFWKKAYDTHTDYVQLPWTGIRPPKPKNNGLTYTTTITNSIDGAIEKLGITKFVFYRSVFALLLHKLTGQHLFYIGSSVDVRTNDSLGAQPAMLNTLPLSSSLESEALPFAKFAHEAQQTIRAALDHRFMPLHDIMKLHPFEQDRLVGPFNVMFDYIVKPSTHTIPGLGIIENAQVFNETSKYDITLTVVESDETTLQWEYDTELLDERTVQQFAAMFTHLCHAVTEDVERPIADIPLLGHDDEQAMLAIGRGDRRAHTPTSFYNQFIESANNNPDAFAITQAGANTTYRDLGYLVDHYSGILTEQTLAHESPVGVFMDRSVEMIAIIIALWRLGYAYVPIETSLPSHRIETIINTTKMPIILTTSLFRNKLPSHLATYIIDETYISNTIHIPDVVIAPDTLAYIIFTSGSTGTPKGVMIEHAGMMNHTAGMIEYFHLDSAATIAQTASHSFDISVWQLTTVLLVGGKIAIYSKDEQADIDAFTQQLFDDKVTILELVPSYMTVLLEYIEDAHAQQRIANIAALISTGENISWRIVESWFRNSPNGLLINAYGPAEASDDTNLFTFQRNTIDEQRGLPIGSPLANIDVYVLSEALHPQPIGIQGEIYIAGIAIGRGYINDPERTQQSFVTHPSTGERMYKTGDIGYWSSDSQLMYTGRSDFQVKLRGFRIELEEIESQISRYSHITSAAVVVAERNNSKQLHAYVTADIYIDIETVFAYLRDQLPEYMVPSTIIQLSALPLNNSGKVDRHLLANKERLRFKEIETTAVPTESETAVMAVWQQVFKLDHVSIDDDYYVLGGDSITSFRVYAKLNSLGYQVVLQDILAAPILKDFAKTIHQKIVTTSPAPATDMAFSLTPIQSRFLTNDKQRAVMPQNISVKGHWDKARLNQAVQAVIRQQAAFSLTFNQTEQTFTQNYKVSAAYMFTEAAISDNDAFERLNQQLKQGTLFAYGGRESNDEVSTLFMSANHLVIDLVSWSILLSAIEATYTHTTVIQPDYSFGSWAQALQKSKDPSPEIIHYWQTILNETKAATSQLAAQFNRTVPTAQVYSDQISIPAIPITESSVYNVVLRAITETFGIEQPGILIETHGRYSDVVGVDVSQTIGWFTHLMPLTGKSVSDVEKIIRLDDATKLAYGVAIQRQLLNQNDEPTIIVNYLGKLTTSEFAIAHSVHEVPINNELMECIIYQDDTRVHVELVLYATPVDDDSAQKFINQIIDALAIKQTDIDSDRLQAILQRIGGDRG